MVVVHPVLAGVHQPALGTGRPPLGCSGVPELKLPGWPRWPGQTMIRTPDNNQAATRAPHHGQQSREVITLSATGQLGMAAPGQIQLTVVIRDLGVAVRLSANRWAQYPQGRRSHAAAKINPWPVSHVSRSFPSSGLTGARSRPVS